MPVIVNGVELNDADLERELPRHADAGNPMRSAITALVLRRVLLDEAGRGWTPTTRKSPSARCWPARRGRRRPTRPPAGASTRPIPSASWWAS